MIAMVAPGVIDGRTDLVELSDALKDSFEAGNGFHTLAGLVLDRLGRFPHEGEVVRLGRWEAEIVDMDARRIDKLLLRLAEPRPGATSDG